AASPSPGITNPTDAANNGVDDAFGGGSNTDGSALPAPGSGATGPGSIGGPVVARPPGGINPNVPTLPGGTSPSTGGIDPSSITGGIGGRSNDGGLGDDEFAPPSSASGPTQDGIPNDPVGGLLGGGSGSTTLPDVTTATEERTNVDPTVPGDVDLDDQHNELEELAREQRVSGAFADFDWQIVSVTRTGRENDLVLPGSTLRYDLRLRKYDPGNNMPDVRLITEYETTVAPLKRLKRISLDTSTENQHAEITVQIALGVPFASVMAPGESREWAPKFYLSASDGEPLQDQDMDNHHRELSLNITVPEVDWEIVSVTPNNPVSDPLLPGSKLSYSVRLRKYDPRNEYRTVYLYKSASVARFEDTRLERISLNSSAENPYAEVTKQLEITVPLERDMKPGQPYAWEPFISLMGEDVNPLQDSNMNNHRHDFSLNVTAPKADWQIVSLTPTGPTNDPLQPGSKLTFDVLLRKQDPANFQPKVILVTKSTGDTATETVMRGLTWDFSTGSESTESALPLEFSAPPANATAPGESYNWTITAYLADIDQGQLYDKNEDNHRRSWSFDVTVPPLSGNGQTELPDVETAAEENTNVNTTVPGDIDLADQRNDLEELARQQRESGAFADVDWQIVSVTPTSPLSKSLMPGTEINYDVRLRKYDPGNKQPDVSLVLESEDTVGRSIQQKPISLTTSVEKQHDEVTAQLSVWIPFANIMQPGESREWTPELYLTTSDGDPLQDSNMDNHRRNLPLIVAVPEDDLSNCQTVVESSDGNTQNCLVKSGEQLPEIYFDDDSLAYTNVARNLSTREGRLILGGAMRHIEWWVRGNTPCAVEIESNDYPSNGKRSNRLDVCDYNYGSSISSDAGDVLQPPNIHDVLENKQEKTVIDGIQVCRDEADSHFWGVQFRLKELDRHGNISTAFRFESEEMSYCSRRTEWQYCPSGTIARGLRVWVTSGTNMGPKDSVHSLDLICSTPLTRATRN
ncbi:MAG: hypothetical protein AAF351_14935, partial [Pseudomonadota bacterium]